MYDAEMRTTVDLDPDVDARLRALARERRVPLRQVINEALRAATAPSVRAPERYVLPTRRLGLRPGVDVDKALALAAADEEVEVARRVELRK